jgi:AFG3 family protein
MIKKVLSGAFNIILVSYIFSFTDHDNIITFRDFNKMSDININKLLVEKSKNYCLIEYENTCTAYNTCNTYNISSGTYKIEYPSINYLLDSINKTELHDKIIYMTEKEIHYKTILFILFILVILLDTDLVSNRLVTDLNLLVSTTSKYSFKNIAGMHEIKEDIQIYINFINDREKYINIGARLPKGILLVGPPGCGKTLIAKAIAGETGINLYSISASDINEMFVGVGAMRIRKLFNLARKNSPSIIFIDEIDSIGGKRGGQFNRESDNVLNKILVEMDGFTDNENVMVFGATNRIKDLDPALLRSGRFDRKMFIDYPNKKERKEIIEYYLTEKKIKYDNRDELYNNLSKIMVGLSGADIENIVNQSCISAVKSDRTILEEGDIYDAYDEIIVGIKKKERIMSEEERHIVAHHEIGHAIIGYLLKDTEGPIKISIVPRGENILGYAQQNPIEKKLYTKKELLDKVCVLLGGRISEEVFFGKENVTTGAADDIEKLTKILINIAYEYGMFDKNFNYVDKKYLGDSHMDKLNESISMLLTELEEKVRGIIVDNRDNISNLANKLLADDEIFDKDIEKIVGKKYENSI